MARAARKANTQRAKASAREAAKPPAPFPIIGIGASAGGIAALQTFFPEVPADSGFAYVVIQHLDAEHESVLASIIQRSTAIETQTAAEGMEIELGDDDHDERQGSDGAAERIDRQMHTMTCVLRALLRAPRSHPMQHHAGLRQREGQKGADGEERDQMVGDAAKHHQQQPRGKTEVEYADRENQPAADHCKGPGKIPVFSHHAAKAGKIDEAGVG